MIIFNSRKRQARQLAALMKQHAVSISSSAASTYVIPPEMDHNIDNSFLLFGILLYLASSCCKLSDSFLIDTIDIILKDLKKAGATASECDRLLQAIDGYIAACHDDFRNSGDDLIRASVKTYLSYFTEEYAPTEISIKLLYMMFCKYTMEVIEIFK